jgi:hypothetical protein
VDFNGSIEDGVNGTKLFADTNDWASLNLQQIGARENAGGLSADVGDADLGDADLGDADLGDADLGDADLGDADLGDADLGDMSFDLAISSLDATSSSQPLAATSKADRITLNWGGPGIGLITKYSIYRFDAVHTAPVLIGTVVSTGSGPLPPPPATTYDDVVNDFVNSGASCPVTTPTGQVNTCYNTVYTYFLTSSDDKTTSSNSNNTLGEVTHLFVIADNQNAVYGNPSPALTFQVFGDTSSVDPKWKSLVSCAISPVADKYNVGTNYGINCGVPQGTPPPSPTEGVTFNAPYNDGVTLHTPGTLNIKAKLITVTAVANSKTYDGTPSAAATPVITSGTLAYTVPPAVACPVEGCDTVTWTESYDNKNVGTNKTLTPSGTVNDGNSGKNYAVTFVSVAAGTINQAPLTITAASNTKSYDATNTAAAIPTISVSTPLRGSDTVTGLAETYDTPNAGTGKTLSVSAYTINDGNGGLNYKVNTVMNATGVINKVNALIVVTP